VRDTLKTEFGWIEVGSVRYDHDIIIHTDRSVTKRKKKLSKDLSGSYGHTPLSHNELEFLNEEKPDVVYIGTGQYGDLPVTPAAAKVLARYESATRPTPELLPAIERETRRFVAILHVTC
jgi:hypothetical protein